MRKPYLIAGVALLAVASALAVASYGVPTPLKTGSLSTDPQYVGCSTTGVSGELVDDPTAGSAIIDVMNGQRELVTWPAGWTARRTLFGVQIIDRQGIAKYRTGTYVDLMGSYWYVDQSFLACGTSLGT